MIYRRNERGAWSAKISPQLQHTPPPTSWLLTSLSLPQSLYGQRSVVRWRHDQIFLAMGLRSRAKQPFRKTSLTMTLNVRNVNVIPIVVAYWYLHSKTMVSVLNKEPKYKVEKLKYTKMEVGQTRIKNKPSWISLHEVLQSRLINTVYHLLVKNNKGKGRGAY